MKENLLDENEMEIRESIMKTLPRRNFLKVAGLSTAALAVFAVTSCKKESNTGPTMGGKGLSFGTGDVAILNFAYALEQLEAAFYTRVMLNPYSGMSPEESMYLGDITKHEVLHREFFKNALGTAALPTLTLDLTSIDFTSRASVIKAAAAFEDLGVQAYNGAGQYLVTPAYLVIAGQIVSVEGRHAAYLRDLNSYGSFADSTILDMNALEQSKKPQAVIAIATQTFIKTKLDASTLPNS